MIWSALISSSRSASSAGNMVFLNLLGILSLHLRALQVLRFKSPLLDGCSHMSPNTVLWFPHCNSQLQITLSHQDGYLRLVGRAGGPL